MAANYVPDRLYARLFQPWTLPESEWPLCREDWTRVDAICALPWEGRILDVGSGDGTLAAMVCSRNPSVRSFWCYEPDLSQVNFAQERWVDAGWPMTTDQGLPVGTTFDGAIVCEVLEHLTPEAGVALLGKVKASCNPGALVCVTVPHPKGTRAAYPGHINLMDEDDLGDMLYAADFKQLSDSWIGPSQEEYPIWMMVTARA